MVRERWPGTILKLGVGLAVAARTGRAEGLAGQAADVEGVAVVSVDRAVLGADGRGPSTSRCARFMLWLIKMIRRS